MELLILRQRGGKQREGQGKAEPMRGKKTQLPRSGDGRDGISVVERGRRWGRELVRKEAA